MIMRTTFTAQDGLGIVLITICAFLMLGFSIVAWEAGRVNEQLAAGCYCPQDCEGE